MVAVRRELGVLVQEGDVGGHVARDTLHHAGAADAQHHLLADCLPVRQLPQEVQPLPATDKPMCLDVPGLAVCVRES